MNDYAIMVKNYGEDILNDECNPFEHLRVHHDKTEIEMYFKPVNHKEREELLLYDILLILLCLGTLR